MLDFISWKIIEIMWNVWRFCENLQINIFNDDWNRVLCPNSIFYISTISDPCETNPCATGYTCSYSSTPVNDNYYRCTGTADTVPLFKNNKLSHQKISVQKAEMVENNLVQFFLYLFHFVFVLILISSHFLAPCDADPPPCQIGYTCENTDVAEDNYVKCTCNYQMK